MKTMQHIHAELDKYRNELATLYKAQNLLLEVLRRRGGVAEVDYEARQEDLDQSFETIRDRIARFEALRLYRERVSDQGIITELERLRAAYKRHKRVATKRAIEDLEFLTM